MTEAVRRVYCVGSYIDEETAPDQCFMGHLFLDPSTVIVVPENGRRDSKCFWFSSVLEMMDLAVWERKFMLQSTDDTFA